MANASQRYAIVTFAAVMLFGVWLPAFRHALAVGALTLCVAFGSLRVRAAVRSRRAVAGELPRGRSDAEPFVSVHVPLHDEPPKVVARTLNALAKLSYPAFEVIVLDNNTRDPRVWQPVARQCRRLGPRFRFRHVDGLAGAKAGALNLCRSMTDPRAEHVLVVDADYEVAPAILQLALRYLEPDIDYVQFPQAYRSETALGAVAGYGQYFDVFMPAAAADGALLLTGTLSMISLAALDRVGGWRSDSITEDAELGTRLVQQGLRGRYVPFIAGRGMPPHDVASLRRQQHRWTFGNAQALRRLGLSRLAGMRATQALGVISQLVAWFDVTVLAALALGLSVASDAPHEAAVLPSALAIALSPMFYFASLAIAPARLRPSGVSLRAWLFHASTSWEHGSAWLRALAGEICAFARTPKRRRRLRRRDVALPLSLSLVFAGMAAWCAYRAAWLAAGATAAVAATFACALYTARVLGRDLPGAHCTSAPRRLDNAHELPV